MPTFGKISVGEVVLYLVDENLHAGVEGHVGRGRLFHGVVRGPRLPEILRSLLHSGGNKKSERIINPSVPDAPNWRISAFEKRLHETERS